MGKYGWGPAPINPEKDRPVGMQKAYEMALRERCETLERELAQARAYAERNAWLVVEQGKTVVAQAAVVEAARALRKVSIGWSPAWAALCDALHALDD